MSIATLKNQLKDDFSMIPNEVITDSRLSDRAKVVFLYLATHKNNWKVYNKVVMRVLNIKTNQTMADVWKQLIDTGWLTRKQLTGSNGKYSGEYHYILNAKPNSGFEDNDISDLDPDYGKTVIRENRNTENPECGENRILNNTNSIINTNSINNINNTKKINKKEKQIINFDFSGFNEKSIPWINKWLDYKTNELKKPFKTKYAINKFRNKMLEDQESGTLIDNIDYSLYKEYADVYPLPEKRYQKQPDKKQQIKEAINNCNTHDSSKSGGFIRK